MCEYWVGVDIYMFFLSAIVVAFNKKLGKNGANNKKMIN